jgi:hypothetical protein
MPGLLAQSAVGRVAIEPDEARAQAAQATRCAKQRKVVKTFKRTMAAKRTAFFKRHGAPKRRRAFVEKQRARLKTLQRRLARCLKPPAPAPALAPGPAPQAPGSAPPPSDPTPAPTPAPTPVAGPSALDSIADVVSDDALVAPGEISLDGAAEVVRTQLELNLAPGTSKAAFDALLARIGARVVSSVEGVGLPTVRIPDPGSVAALKALAASLRDDPVLDGADLVAIPPPDDLPENVAAGSTDLEFVRAQLAVRSSAAWNARAALDTPPTLLITDYFGDGPPDAALTGLTARPADFSTPASPYSAADLKQSHGYLVAGLAAGAFEPAGGGADSVGDLVAGTWAGPRLPLRVVDIRRGMAGSTLQDRMVLEIEGAPGQVVLNTSLGSPCANNAGGCTAVEAAAGALKWIERVRGRGLEDDFLHVTAAGNMRTAAPSAIGTELHSDYTSAALLPLPDGVANLTNVLVVENAIASPLEVSSPPRVICRNASSKRGGHLSAVGTDVTSLDSADTGATESDGGTSSAAPQVAGVAASMWAIEPGLTPQQVAARLRATARSGAAGSGDPRCNAAGVPAPVLDAYGALVSTGSNAMAAVLDTDDTDAFDEGDLAAFAETFDDAAGAVDHGRFDLNGDGRTGGGGTDRVDLDPAATPRWGLVERAVAGLPITYDENALTDLEVLCHAAHGPLYDGVPDVREQFAAERCVPPISIQAVMPSQAPRDQAITLTVRAARTDRAINQAGVTIELAVTGGSVAPGIGTTDQNGDFTSQAQIGSTASELKVVVTAKAGDRVLDQKTVTATPPPSATVTRTFSRGSATSFAFAGGSGMGKSSVSPGGVTSFTDSVSIDRTENGGTASGSGTLSFSETYAGAQLRGASVDITGVGSAGDEASQGEGGGAYTLRFTVGAGGMPYSVTGSVSANGTDELTCQVARGRVYLFRQTQPGSGLVFDTCAPGDPSAVSESGSLPAGGYEFYVDAIAHTDGGSSNAAADITLSLGP